MRALFWYVPIDDVSHFHVMVTAGPPLVVEGMRRLRDTLGNVPTTIAAILAGQSAYHQVGAMPGQAVADPIRIQDGVAVCGQGASPIGSASGWAPRTPASFCCASCGPAARRARRRRAAHAFPFAPSSSREGHARLGSRGESSGSHCRVRLSPLVAVDSSAVV